eukprot:6960-Chlamydomonas_euryale.AAC.1
MCIRDSTGAEVGTVFDPVALSLPSDSHSGSSRDMAQRARTASRALQALPTSERVAMLERVADALLAHQVWEVWGVWEVLSDMQ